MKKPRRVKNINFLNDKGENLSARLDLPEVDAPAAYALFAHCFTCNKNFKTIVNISESLTRKAIAVLRFDFSGLGESQGEFGDTNFSSNVSDLTIAADFMRKNYKVPKLLIGHSFGGTACLQAAAVISGIKAVAVIGSPAEPRHVKHLLEPVKRQIIETGQAELLLTGRPMRIKKQFLDDLDAIHIEKLMPTLGCALLILHSPVDEVVGIDNAALLFQAAKHPKSFISLDNADHMLSDPGDAAYCGHIIAEWAMRYISS
jgi:alpha/beta superfamily hydrolase